MKTPRFRSRRGLGLGFALGLAAISWGMAQDAPKKDAPGSPAVPKAAPAETPAPAESAAARAEEAPALPPGILARLNGRDITVDEYASYLLASVGKTKLDDYIDRLLVEEEAKRLEVQVSPEEVEASVEERIDRTIKGLYKGNQDLYLANLAKRRMTLEEEKARLRQDRYYDVLRERIILKTRTVTDADIQREFERIHGEGGVRYTLRHILISTRPPAASEAPPVTPPGEGSKAGPDPSRTKAEARERAERLLKELQGGADFVQAVKSHSDDPFTKKNDGRIPQYRRGYYGEDFHKAVTQLTPESPLSGLVESPRGFHIIQLVEKNVTKLEDVRSEIEKVATSQPPTPKERLELTSRLREKAKVEGL